MMRLRTCCAAAVGFPACDEPVDGAFFCARCWGLWAVRWASRPAPAPEVWQPSMFESLAA
jgi:hypothetical protein